MSLTEQQRIDYARAEVIVAARVLADGQACHDPHCTHKVCVLNKALERYDRLCFAREVDA